MEFDNHDPQNQTQGTQEATDAFIDAEIIEATEVADVETPSQKKRKAPKPRSQHWAGYTKIIVMQGDPPVRVIKEKCKRCGTLIVANGTTGLKNHAVSCSKKIDENTGQTVLSFQSGGDGPGGSLTSWKFDQKAIRLALCEMIVLDELPFRFVEREGFRKFIACCCPMFKIPSRKTIREDCVRLHIEHKNKMKSFFMKKDMGRVSITTDCWTTINNTNFICVTAHVIDNNWELHKKIISFRKIISHKGEDIGESIITSINEWDMKKIVCCTVDNASANDGAVRCLRDQLDLWKTNIFGGKYLHLRCVAHIINLIVSDGLEEIGMSVRKVREAVKLIKASPARYDRFNRAKQLLANENKKSLCMDVPTRWNSTYLMLESAEPYEAVLKVYEGYSATFVSDLMQKKYKDQPLGPPNAAGWANVRRMIEYLKKFYDLTCLVSGTTYVTAHLFFKEMCDILDLISELQQHEDSEINLMATKMKSKVGKYWLETEAVNPKMNKILYIAVLLDPRQKLKHVEKCLKKVYGIRRATELVIEVKESINELFEFYNKNRGTTSTPRASTFGASNTSQQFESFDIQRKSIRRGSCSTMQDSSDEEGDDSNSSEVTIYFAEKQFKEPKPTSNEVNVVDPFNVLQWWSTHGLRFSILSELAKDVLAIPISTVASESAFSTGDRVLDDFRSSLNPKMVEALICTEDWLRSAIKHDEEILPEEEQEKEYEAVVSSMTSMSVGVGATSNLEENQESTTIEV